MTDDGSLYYAMELLDGIDLEDLVKLHGPVDPGRVVYLLRLKRLAPRGTGS